MLSRIIKERTSWDGAIIIGVCGAVLLLGGLAEIVCWAGIVYGAWTIYTKE